MSQEPITPVPSLLAALLCDQVILDQLTQKKTLVGIFEAFNFPQFPASYGGFFLFARITDAEGQINLKIRFVRLEDDVALGEMAVPMVAKDRLEANDVMLQIPPLPFDRPGGYEFQLFTNDVYIGRALVRVNLTPGGQSAD